MIEKQSLDLLQTLIGFDTTSFKSNLNLIKFIENYLNQYEIKSELVYDDTKNKANLFATIGPNSTGGIVLSGHTDVVPVGNQKWDTDPFQLIEKDQKLYGRGASDMKSFIALVLSRVPKIIEKKLSKPIHLAFSYDEEIGCVGVHGLLDLIEKKSIKPEFCIVGEPTSMEVVIGHKGKHAYSVKVDGLSCHSGQAPFGVNAINYASKLIAYIDELNKEKSINGPFDQDYEVPYTTLHTGLINGGTILNIVPNLCEFEFEIRNLATDDPLKLVNKIKDYTNQKLINDMHKVSSKTGIHFNEKVNYPALDISADIKPVKKIKELLNNQKHKKVVYGTEGGLFKNRFDIPTIVCGPGSIDQAHKPNEYISIEQIKKCSNFLDNLISSYH
jgi:acetylornithine deacetylase|tara:strand:+ start:419 stop:1576 length:1158 start_codon:yes stop_codon:yes gene_type:complete